MYELHNYVRTCVATSLLHPHCLCCKSKVLLRAWLAVTMSFCSFAHCRISEGTSVPNSVTNSDTSKGSPSSAVMSPPTAKPIYMHDDLIKVCSIK